MRVGVYALLAISTCGGGALAQAAFGQTPQTGTAPDQTDPGQLPPTPLQERDRQIRQFDPLDRDDQAGKDKAKADREAEKRRQEDQAPIPGSIAATERNSASRSGPQVVEDADAEAPVQVYAGPAVLSRSYSINQPLIPQQLKWQESMGVNAVFNNGVTAPLAPNGSPGAPIALTGSQLTWGISGRHYFRRDVIGVSYSGNMSLYSGAGTYNGSNQNIAVTWSHVLSRRLTLNLSGAGSILSQNYTLENQPVGPDTIANINISSSPNIQIYDTGAKQFSSQVELTWQKTSRLSFSIGASDFGIARNSPQLLGMTGQQARGDVNYRLTRKTTVGAYYSYSYYLYPHGFGNSDSHTAGLIYSYAFNQTTQIRFRGGLSRVESLGLETVPIIPAIAALLGQSAGIIDSYTTYRTTDLSAQFVKDFRRGATASIAYAHGISPGNGVFQGSQQESISAGFTLKIFRTYGFAAAGGRDTLSSVTQDLGKYQSLYARISLARTYSRRGIGVSSGVEYRHIEVGTLGFLRNQLRITSGISWSPGAGRLWPF